MSLLPRWLWALALVTLLTPSMQGAFPAVPWSEVANGVPPQPYLARDPALLLALWIGVSMAVAGVGVTVALVHGRLPDVGEIDQVRHRLSDTAHRLRRLAGQ